MIITPKQIIHGAASWLDSEVLSTMGSASKYGLGIVASLLSKRGEALLEQAMGNDTVQALGLVRDGGYDLDELRSIMLERFPPEGIRIDAEQINGAVNRFLGKLAPIINYQVQGGITFHRSDLERLLNAIMEGSI